jgi:hypothetical protein
MAKILCVLYPDPESGYPPKYARDDIPTIGVGYANGQTAPAPKGLPATLLPPLEQADMAEPSTMVAQMPIAAGPVECKIWISASSKPSLECGRIVVRLRPRSSQQAKNRVHARA